MAKLNIDFVLMDESVVMHGFRSLMSGGEIEGFKKNPVMLLQHNRPKEFAGADDIMLPLGKWYDIRIEGAQLLAKPEFDDDDALAMRIQKKVEKGYLNGASIWIEPTTFSDDPADLLPGQNLPTFTKWGLLEASIVDIPNCRGSLAIRNGAGEKILLNGNVAGAEIGQYIQSLSKKTDMSILKLMAVKLGLAETATEEAINNKVAEVLQASQEAIAKVTKLEAEKVVLSAKITELETAQDEAKINGLVDGAIAENKLAAGEREDYIKLAKADFETTQGLLAKMKPYTSVKGKLEAGAETDLGKLAELMKLSGRELYMQGKFEDLKKLSLDGYKEKHLEYFGVEYKA